MGLRPDPMGELTVCMFTVLPRPPSWIKGVGPPGRGKRKRKGAEG